MNIHVRQAGMAAALSFALCLGGAAAQAWAKSPAESALVSHHHYVNSSGHVVHSPSKTVSGRAPAGASARCGDGSYSFSEHRRGTCSHHGGVASWL